MTPRANVSFLSTYPVSFSISQINFASAVDFFSEFKEKKLPGDFFFATQRSAAG
jgi:hypothetical protein